MRLPAGVIRHESALWEGGSLLLIDGRDAVAVDPGILPDEVERLRSSATAAGATVRHVLVTHADWDHLAGLSAFADATAWMGPLAAARVASGEADEALVGAARDFGVAAGARARVDRVLEPGVAAQVGPFVVESVALPGHTPDVIGLRVRARGVLAVGDYLSTFEPPWIKGTSASYRATLAALLDTLERDPPEVVVPGHGPAHPAAAAREVAGADLDYLHAIRRAVLGAGDERAAALAAGLAVVRPRGDDEAAETSHRDNVARHVDELVAGG